MALYLRRNPLVFASAVKADLTTTINTEVTLATVTIPGGSMGPNGFVEAIATYSANNDASGKFTHTRFGGPTGLLVGNLSMTSFASSRQFMVISNRNSLTSQISSNPFNGGFASQTAAIVTGAIDTSANVDLLFRVSLTDAADTISLESYIVKVFYQP